LIQQDWPCSKIKQSGLNQHEMLIKIKNRIQNRKKKKTYSKPLKKNMQSPTELWKKNTVSIYRRRLSMIEKLRTFFP